MAQYSDSDADFLKFIKHPIVRKIGFGILLIILFLFLNPVKIIESNERGLRFTLGSLSKTVLQSGAHLRVPIIQTIIAVDIRPVELNSAIPVGPDGAITKDNQTVGAKLRVFYVYKQSDLLVMWKDYGEDKIKSLIESAIKESFKSAIGAYTIFDIPLSQNQIQSSVIADIRRKLEKYPIELTELRITNYDWSDQFDAQIQATMEKAQEAKQKEQELKVSELEAQKIVKKADADKQATIVRAEGGREAARLDAEAMVLKGEGIRKFNESIRATKDIELKLRELDIEKMRVDKWDGAYVPTNNYGPIPIETGRLKGQ